MSQRKSAIIAILVIGIIEAIVLFMPRAPQHVVRVTGKNDALQQAASEAQKSLPKFLDRLKHKKPGEQFAILGRFPSTAGPEYLWLKDPEIAKDNLRATLDQQPVAIRAKRGDSVLVPIADVFDWMIKTPSGIEGGLTQKALQP